MNCKRWRNFECVGCDLNSDDCYLEYCNYFGYDELTFNLAYNILEKETEETGYKTIIAKKYFHKYDGFERLYNQAKAMLRSEKIKSFL